MRLRVYFDEDFGAVAAAIDDNGEIVATAASHVENGVYVAVDETQVYEATGELLPLPLWDKAVE
jgi:hypothetical protein